MHSLRTLGLLGFTLLAAPAIAQTTPAPRKAPAKTTRPAPRAASSSRGNSDSGKGQGSYAAPGEPINVQDNGKNTPPYDGPAAGHGSAPKGTTLAPKQQ